MKNFFYLGIVFCVLIVVSCDENDTNPVINGWEREMGGPVFRDFIISENYQTASDAHIFYDGGTLNMIYTGDYNGKASIKLSKGSSLNTWTPVSTLLGDVGPSGLDSHKETGFYRKTPSGKHQIYYIGYDNESTYEAQVFLAEADSIEGPYIQMNQPIIPKGMIAGKNVYCITSPSVVKHGGLLYMMFIGWNNSPSNVTEVWIMGATSSDEGYTWSDFQIVETKIGMEGQVTKVGESEFIAVRTGEFENVEAIFYATASHPFGPWDELDNPILVQAGAPYEKDEIIAPQITINPSNGEQVLYYTGADYDLGWWIMMATRE